MLILPDVREDKAKYKSELDKACGWGYEAFAHYQDSNKKPSASKAARAFISMKLCQSKWKGNQSLLELINYKMLPELDEAIGALQVSTPLKMSYLERPLHACETKFW